MSHFRFNVWSAPAVHSHISFACSGIRAFAWSGSDVEWLTQIDDDNNKKFHFFLAFFASAEWENHLLSLSLSLATFRASHTRSYDVKKVGKVDAHGALLLTCRIRRGKGIKPFDGWWRVNGNIHYTSSVAQRGDDDVDDDDGDGNGNFSAM